MLVKVDAPKRRSLAWVVDEVKPDEARFPFPEAWATRSTGLVADTPLYSWIARLILPLPATFAVTEKFDPPLAFAEYQTEIGSSPDVGGEGSSTALE
jgi:hypothetical protein